MFGAVLGVALHLMVPSLGAAQEAAPRARVAGAQLDRDVSASDPAGRRAAGAVLRVEASGCGEQRQASATLVQGLTGDLLLTNSHVVRGSTSVSVRAEDGTERTAEVVGTILGRDAAVLELERTADDPFVAGPIGSTPGVGDPVVVAGYPAGDPELHGGSVGAVEFRSGYGGTTEVLVIGSDTRPGSSGGAVIDASGRVVGLVAARDPGSGSAVAYPMDALLTGTLGPPPGC